MVSEVLRLTETIAESAKYEESVDRVVQTGDAAWRVDFEDVSVELDLDEPSGRLVLASDLGVPAQDRRLDVYEALLSYALLWRDTGFVRVGLGGANGPLALMADMAADGLQPAALAAILADFAQKTLIWRDFVAAANSEAASSDLHLTAISQFRA